MTRVTDPRKENQLAELRASVDHILAAGREIEALRRAIEEVAEPGERAEMLWRLETAARLAMASADILALHLQGAKTAQG